MDSLTVYISVPIVRCAEAYTLQLKLRAKGITVLNPCESIPSSCPKEKLPAYVARHCYEMIDRAPVMVLFADYYGRDCAAEVGYAIHAGKAIFPVTLQGTDSANLLVDWMIRPMVRPLSRSIEELVARLIEYQSELIEAGGSIAENDSLQVPVELDTLDCE